MAKPCKTCSHPKLAEIDAAIFSNETGVSICKRFKLTRSQFRAHLGHAQPPAGFKPEKPQKRNEDSGVRTDCAPNGAAENSANTDCVTTEIAENFRRRTDSAGTENAELQPDSIAELLEQRKRLLEDIQLAKESKNSYHQLKGEAALQKNIELHSKLEADKNNQNLDAAIQTAAKAQINSLVRFLIGKLSDYPEALKALQRALQSEYGLIE